MCSGCCSGRSLCVFCFSLFGLGLRLVEFVFYSFPVLWFDLFFFSLGVSLHVLPPVLWALIFGAYCWVSRSDFH